MEFISETLLNLASSMDLTALLGFIVLLFIIIYFNRSFGRDRRLAKFAATLPGPSALPIIGNGYEFFINGTKNIPNLLSQYNEKYGSTYRLWLGNRLVVGLADVDDLQVVYSHPNTINKPELLKPYYSVFDISTFALRNETWKQSRKLLQPTISNQLSKMRIPIFNEVIKKYIDILEKHVDGPEFDLDHYFPYLSTDFFTKSLLSLEMNWETKHYYNFHQIMHLVDEMIISRIFIPIAQCRWIGDILWRKKLNIVRNKMKHFLKNEISKKNSNLEIPTHNEGNSGDIIRNSLVSAVHEFRRRLGLRTPLHSEVNDVATFLTVTSHTTSATTCAFLMAIAIHSEIQEKLYDEICDLFGDSNRSATYEDILKLQYLDQVIKETLRRFTLIPLLFRDVEADTDIGSRIIPKGTQLMLRVMDVHFNPKWYPNPMEFNPENFSPEAISKRPKYAFLAFSAGVRDCIGKPYANITMKLLIIELLRNFKFNTSKELKDADSSASLTTYVPGGYKLSIKRRNSHL